MASYVVRILRGPPMTHTLVKSLYLSVDGTWVTVSCDFCDYIICKGKGSFTDVIRFPNQLIWS